MELVIILPLLIAWMDALSSCGEHAGARQRQEDAGKEDEQAD